MAGDGICLENKRALKSLGSSILSLTATYDPMSKCPFCSMKIKTWGELLVHVKNAHPEKLTQQFNLHP